MPHENERVQIWKDFFSYYLAKNLIRQIIGRHLRIDRHPARTATVAGATPIDFVRSQRVFAAATIVRGEAWCDNDSIGEGVCKKCGGERCAKIIIRITVRAVNHDKHPLDRFVLRLQRIGTIDKRPRLAAKVYPLATIRRGFSTWFGSVGRNERRQKKREAEVDVSCAGGYNQSASRRNNR